MRRSFGAGHVELHRYHKRARLEVVKLVHREDDGKDSKSSLSAHSVSEDHSPLILRIIGE
jgi:hypothetical protein